MAVLGTRPEVFKLAPVVRALRGRGHRVLLVTTGQHPMVAARILAEEGLGADRDLAVHRPGNSPSDLVAAILERLAPELQAARPALVLVQGDTASTFAGALAAFHEGVPVAHVEAGLRTGDLAGPFPEEGYRAMVARIARLHFAPTAAAVAQLRREGVPRAQIHLTGNTGIDALHAVCRRLEEPGTAEAMAARFAFVGKTALPLVVATIHRRENLGPRLLAIAAGLKRLAAFGVATIALPLHPNPAIADLLVARLGGLAHVRLLPPLEHMALVWLLLRARLVVTDSGGVQEEAPTLGVRALVVREATERGEAVAAGMARLVPPRADILARAVVEELGQPPAAPVALFGDGRASARIVRAIERELGWPVGEARISRLGLRQASPSAARSRESSLRSAGHRRS